MSHQLIKIFFLGFCSLVFFVPTGDAQENQVKFTALTTKDGLSANTVNAILKDKFGLLWFGTEEGLNRFDGLTFNVYRQRTSDSTSLQSNVISALHEDKSGRLWIGTIGGSIHLYNRKKDNFIHYFQNPNAQSSNIKAICSDFRNDLWVGTLAGLQKFRLDPKTYRLAQVRLPGGIHFNNSVLSLFESRDKKVWIGTKEGLYCYSYETGRFTYFKHDKLNPQSIAGNVIRSIVQDRQGRIWIGSNEGLSMLSANGKDFLNYTYTEGNKNSISSSFIHSLTIDANDQLWIATEGGLDILDLNTRKFNRNFPDERNKYSLTNRSIRSLLADRQGIVWVGTYEGGINKYDKNLTLFNVKRSNKYDPLGLSAPFITSFAENNNGDVFVGTDGGGLNLFQRKTGLFRRYDIKQHYTASSSGLAILALAMAKDKSLWMATYQDGLFRLDPETGNYRQFKSGNGPLDLNSNDIFCLKIDHLGKIWAGTNGGGVNVMDPNKKIIFKYAHTSYPDLLPTLPLNGFIRAIEEDESGNIWIGSFGTGIAVFNPLTNAFRVIERKNSALPSDNITCMLKGRFKQMWIGTAGSGLVQMTEGKNIRCFGKASGLANLVIHAIVEDQNGGIWVSTNQGVSLLNSKTGKFKNYTYYNGLQNNAFVSGAGLKTRDGAIFFGGIEGFNYFYPKDQRVNKNVPPIIFTELVVGNKVITSTDSSVLKEPLLTARTINLEYKQNFTIGFVALNYTSPKQNSYTYRLKGFEKDWVPAGNKTTATYTNLSPGKYTFEVRASNNDHVWNKRGASITIIIQPPFWMTGYAYAVYLFVLLFTGWLFRQRGIRKLQQQFRIEQEKREAEKLHELDRLKIKFLTNISHEFRTPIALIMAPADKLLAQLPVDDGMGTQVRMIKRNARRLLNLVNQLLDLRKMENKELLLNLVEADIVSFIRDVSDSFQDLSERKKVEFYVETEITQLTTAFDPDKLERILFNLLSNAFKFTPEGGRITLRLSYINDETAQEHPKLLITLIDTGVGIPAEKQAKVFDRFYQNEDSPSLLNQGSGIGLAITKEFVEMHGGKIFIESETGAGSTFIIELPCPSATIQTPAAPASSEKTQELPGDGADKAVVDTAIDGNFPVKGGALPTILIIEDNEEFRFYLKDNLMAMFTIIEAPNGKEGWQKALSHHPQLIVSDIAMPVMDGIELSRKIRGDKRTKHIPLILLTASVGEENQLKGLETGANDYLIKPFNFEILNTKISNLLRYNSVLKKAYTRQVSVKSEEIDMENGNERFLKNMLAYIEENLNNPQLSVDHLSKYVGMSRVSLYHKVLEITGQSPVDFIRSIKLDKAASLLEKSDMNVAQIGYMVGFATPNYFAKSFKVKYNLLPSEYMAKYRKPKDPKATLTQPEEPAGR